MPRFWYEALSPNGERVKDEGEFASLAELYDGLRKQGYILIDYRKKLTSFTSSLPRKISRLELAEFCRNLSLVIKGGIPLVDAMRDMTNSPGIGNLRRLLAKVIMRLEGGELLSEALSRYRNHFPNILIVLVKLGEETGRLDKTLKDAADHFTRVQEIIDKTKKALSYPAAVLAAMLGALGFWMIYVLPKLFELFTSMGMKELPWTTRFLMDSVEFAKTYWPVVPVLFVFLGIFGFLSTRYPRVKMAWDRLWLKFPLIGKIIKASQLAFFFEYLSLLTESGIDIMKSLRIMEEALSHSVLKEDARFIRDRIASGGNLSSAFEECHIFEPFVLRMIKVGETSGSMPDQLSILSQHYMGIVNRLVDSIAQKIEPMLITFAGVIFAIIMIGLLGPIYDLMGKIQ